MHELLWTTVTMLPKAFPDELVHQIAMELHFSSLDDKEFYVSRREPERRPDGIHWAHGHLLPLSVINNQFRRVCLPTLFDQVDIIANCYRGEGPRLYYKDVSRFIELLSRWGHVRAAIKHINIVSVHASYRYEPIYRPLIDALSVLPNVQILSGLSYPSKQFIMAINGLPLTTFAVGDYDSNLLPLECLKNEPDILRKLRMQDYHINDITSMQWLNVADPVYVNHLHFSSLQISRNFLAKKTPIPFLRKISIGIADNEYREAAHFTEKLQAYLDRLGQSVTCLSFDLSVPLNELHWIEAIPLAGSLRDVFSLVQGSNQDSSIILCDYEISLATQQPSFRSNWDKWRVTSLFFDSCFPDEQFLRVVSERAPFLESLDVSNVDSDAELTQWRHAILSTETLVKLFRPFSFLNNLQLPRVYISPALFEELSRDNDFETSEEDADPITWGLSVSILENICRALGNEMYSLLCVGLSVEHDIDEFNFLANLRQRVSRDGPWVEVDVHQL